MRRGRRKLSEDEKALWDLVARTATRLGPETSIEVPPEAVAGPVPKAPAVPPKPPIHDFMIGVKADPRRPHDISPPVHVALHNAPVVMDHKTHKKMTKGKLSPDARIDLHGMTVAEAHSELLHFVLTSHDLGHRLVLVITGKGKERDEGGPIPTRMGILRHQVPQWLRLPPLSRIVMQTTPAHVKHGGHGAYYVYLRRVR